MPKIGLNFKGWDKLMEDLVKMSSRGAEEAARKALEESHEYVTDKLKDAIRDHVATGDTKESLRKEAKVDKVGNTLTVPIGFEIYRGGFPSIFLMYGTPRMNKDQALYDAIYGRKTRKNLGEIQEKILTDALREYTGG